MNQPEESSIHIPFYEDIAQFENALRLCPSLLQFMSGKPKIESIRNKSCAWVFFGIIQKLKDEETTLAELQQVATNVEFKENDPLEEAYICALLLHGQEKRIFTSLYNINGIWATSCPPVEFTDRRVRYRPRYYRFVPARRA